MHTLNPSKADLTSSWTSLKISCWVVLWGKTVSNLKLFEIEVSLRPFDLPEGPEFTFIDWWLGNVRNSSSFYSESCSKMGQTRQKTLMFPLSSWT